MTSPINKSTTREVEPVTICDQLDESIENRILVIRDQQVMLDRDLAELYGVETKVLNQAVKRNINRFPERFRFQLSVKEMEELVTTYDRYNSLRHSSVSATVFTEQGVAMLSSVLRSDTAISTSIRIMEAFVAMRHFLQSNIQMFQRLETMEFNQLRLVQHQAETDKRLDELFRRLDEGSVKPRQGIFYNGQVYDAYMFVSGLIKSASRSILLIDNYLDETVLTLLDKRVENVSATIYTRKITNQLELDIERHNAQYPPIKVLTYQYAHDRFLCIDADVYHIGASVKDLGKKWFAFSKMEDLTPNEILFKISNL